MTELELLKAQISDNSRSTGTQEVMSKVEWFLKYRGAIGKAFIR